MKEIRIRPAGSGKDGTAQPFLRKVATPRAGLILASEADLPGDWNEGPSGGNAEGELGHALGWTLEVRRKELMLLNPLGEGLVCTDLPELEIAWERSVRADGSCAVFLAETTEAATGSGASRAATVRTAFADDYGKAEEVGRNQPCPCGSGKKHKHCCGR